MTLKMFAHRYKDTHTNRRKKLRRWAKEGKARLIKTERDGFLYEIVATNPMPQGRQQKKAGATPARLPRFSDDGRPVQLRRSRKADGSGEPMGTAGSAVKASAESGAGASAHVDASPGSRDG